MIKNKMSALAGCALLAVGLAACGSSSSSSSTTSTSTTSATISGAGSTFAAPVYEQWASSLSPLKVNYQAVGSGAGITSLESKTVDFGASDPPLKAADEATLAKNGSPAVEIPMFLGAITVSYNLPGVTTGLKLDGKTVADIYLGKVKTWNDAEIEALNPGITLPSTAITVVHRSDSSGTTDGFTGFLSDVDPEWKSKVGEGKTVQWPTGTGAKGNAGVAAAVEQTAGAVGYVEQAYALEHKFTYASVKNKAGSFVAPTLASTSAAAEGVTVPANLGIKISNPPGAERLPDHLADVHRRQQGPLQGRHPGRRSGRQGRGQVPRIRARGRTDDPLQGRLRRAARCDPRQVQGSGRGPAVQRRRRSADRDATARVSDRQRAVEAGAIPSGGRATARAVAAGAPAGPRAQVRADRAGGADPGADRLLLHPPVRRSASRVRQGRRASASCSATTGTSSAEHFGALPLVVGTLITSALALVIGVPVAVAAAVYATELCPLRMRAPLTVLVELLAAVPSVVYGLWGIFFLAPKLQPAEQWVADRLSFIPFIGGGLVTIPNYFITGLVLAIMILPIVSAISREVMATVPSRP